MVACAGDELVAAHQIEPRIAAVRPIGRIALQQAGDDRRARRVDQRLLRRIAQQLVMTGHDRVLQEAQRIDEGRLAFALEHCSQRLQRELRSDLAFRMPAHAVGQREQAGVARIAITHAFVLVTAALAADLVDGEAHGVVASANRRDGRREPTQRQQAWIAARGPGLGAGREVLHLQLQPFAEAELGAGARSRATVPSAARTRSAGATWGRATCTTRSLRQVVGIDVAASRG
jgi:hypothetical protein